MQEHEQTGHHSVTAFGQIFGSKRFHVLYFTQIHQPAGDTKNAAGELL